MKGEAQGGAQKEGQKRSKGAQEERKTNCLLTSLSLSLSLSHTHTHTHTHTHVSPLQTVLASTRSRRRVTYSSSTVASSVSSPAIVSAVPNRYGQKTQLEKTQLEKDIFAVTYTDREIQVTSDE